MPTNGILNLTASDIARIISDKSNGAYRSVEIQISAKDLLMIEFEKHKLDKRYGLAGLNFAPTADGWRVTAAFEQENLDA